MPSLGILLRHSRRHFSSSSSPTTPFGTFKCVRDRGLDHAVEREKNLIPLLNTIALLASHPSNSLPASSIADLRHSLAIPLRPIDFLRRHPAVFRESPGVHPAFSLTDRALDLRSEEALMLRSDSYRHDVASRLLRLLMLCRANKVPIPLLRRLRLDLGLPEDFETSLVPDFPDYFRLVGTGESSVLELVCWIKEFAVSAMEKEGNSGVFPVQYSRGFEMDKKFKKSVDDWQKLPYFSPYEYNSNRFSSSAEDESDRWAAAILHELLHILVPKKTEKENVLCVGDWLGLRSRFKKVLLRHPGIFYLSSKNYTYTVVLKEGYRRGVLVENHPLMDMRSKFIHLMNSSAKEEGDKLANQRESDQKVEKEVENEEEKMEGESLDSSEDDKDEDFERGVGIDRRRPRKRDSMVKGRVAKRERHPREKRERVGEKMEGESCDSSEDEDVERGIGIDRRRSRKRDTMVKGCVAKRERHPRENRHRVGGKMEGQSCDSPEDEDAERGVGIDRRRPRKRDSMVKGHAVKRERHPRESRERVGGKISLETEKKCPSSRGRSRGPSKRNKGSSAALDNGLSQ